MKVSESGIDHILKEEGFSSKAYFDDYKDTARVEHSIGYGHQIKPHEEYLMTKIITKEEGKAIFRADLAQREKEVKALLKVPVTQNQFDALVMFYYNAPRGARAVIALINAKSPTSNIVTTWRSYNKWLAKGPNPLPALVRRRELELKLFLGSSYDQYGSKKKERT